jgi:hypothetical protein
MAAPIEYYGNDPPLVAADIENHPASTDKIDAGAKRQLHIGRPGPLCRFANPKPVFERFPRLRLHGPIGRNGAARYHPHAANIACFHFANKRQALEVYGILRH